MSQYFFNPITFRLVIICSHYTHFDVTLSEARKGENQPRQSLKQSFLPLVKQYEQSVKTHGTALLLSQQTIEEDQSYCSQSCKVVNIELLKPLNLNFKLTGNPHHLGIENYNIK